MWVLLVVGLLAQMASAELRCKLRYDIRDYMDWYEFGGNIVLGLYENPASIRVEDCRRCDEFGNVLGELHYKVVDLEDQR